LHAIKLITGFCFHVAISVGFNVFSGAVDYFVEMQLPKDAVKQCKTPDGRDVHRVPDRDIKLDRETKPRIDKTPGAAKK